MTIKNDSVKCMHAQSSLSERQHLGAVNPVGLCAADGMDILHMLRVLNVDCAPRMAHSSLKGHIMSFRNCVNDLLVTTVQRTKNEPKLMDSNNVDTQKVLIDG